MKVRCRVKESNKQTRKVIRIILPTVQMEKSASSTKFKVETIFNLLTVMFSLITCSLAFFTLYFSLYPQYKPSNTNYLEMANAGDVKSQVRLAHLNYQIGQLDNAVYWYEIASLQESEYQGIALNNLASIYLNYEDYSIRKTNIYRDSMDMFIVAMDSGEFYAAQNLYLLLISNPESFFGDRYETELNNVQAFLSDYDDILQDLSQFKVQWEHVETVTDPNDTQDYLNNPNYKIKRSAPLWDPDSSSHVFFYEILEKSGNSNLPSYKYIDIAIS